MKFIAGCAKNGVLRKRKNQENRSRIGQNETDPGEISVSGL